MLIRLDTTNELFDTTDELAIKREFAQYGSDFIDYLVNCTAYDEDWLESQIQEATDDIREKISEKANEVWDICKTLEKELANKDTKHTRGDIVDVLEAIRYCLNDYTDRI